ncbi:MAG: AAA family ATPase, partial [Nitrospirae bacterium]
MKNIVLVGFMGTGKSAVGRRLAEKLGMEFVELDAEVEAKEGISIKEIFERYGE